MNPDQFCKTTCAAGTVCQFHYDPNTCKPGSHEGCFSCQPPRTRPNRPTRPGQTTTAPRRTERPNMRNCAEFGRGEDVVSDQGSCLDWQLCTSHRGKTSWIDAAGSDDAQCCCDVEDKHFCCGVADAPQPDTKKCDGSLVATCSAPFFTALTCAKALPGDTITKCDPTAPRRSAARQACFAYYDCLKRAYGSNFKQCCNCIDYFATEFDKDLALDCEDPGDGDDDDK